MWRRGGLILNYDSAGNAFTGTVENTTSNVLVNVRIEVHLSNGTELGPTTPVDLLAGQMMDVNLPSNRFTRGPSRRKSSRDKTSH